METIYHAGDILEAAKVLDLNILRDTALLWIAEDFWLSPLPDDWEEAVTVSFFYANTANFPPKKKIRRPGVCCQAVACDTRLTYCEDLRC